MIIDQKVVSFVRCIQFFAFFFFFAFLLCASEFSKAQRREIPRGFLTFLPLSLFYLVVGPAFSLLEVKEASIFALFVFDLYISVYIYIFMYILSPFYFPLFFFLSEA